MKLQLTLFLIIFICYLSISQTKSYKYPSPLEITKRVNYLQRVIQEPLYPNSEIIQLGNTNYEFMLFSYSFSSYAMTNLAIRDTQYKKQAIQIIKSGIEKVQDYRVSSYYGIQYQLLHSDSIPDFSVLYLGHLNLMLGCYRLLTKDSSYNLLNDKISKSLFHRYTNSKFLNLESYSNSIWIPDNTVALASLKLHSINTKSRYDTICKNWVKYAKANYLDKKTGVLFSTINPETGKALEEPRGSMLGWSIMFIYRFDKDFAVDLYKNYKTHFSKNYLLFRLFKERNNSNETNMGDMDSGPLFRGYSIPANEFALSNAVLAKDYKTAKKISRLINFGTKRIDKNNELKYRVKFVDMNISPLAEAMVLYSLTMTEWKKD